MTNKPIVQHLVPVREGLRKTRIWVRNGVTYVSAPGHTDLIVVREGETVYVSLRSISEGALQYELGWGDEFSGPEEDAK